MSQDIQFEGGFTPESWEYARAFAGSLGSLPSSFTSVIRLLVTDFDKDPSSLSQYGSFFCTRLLRTPSVQAPYFNAIRFLKPQLLTNPSKAFTTKNFLGAFGGYEHAVFLATIFLHRHCRNLCNASLLQDVTHRLQRGLNLGWLIGNAIPSIGPGAGLLLGGFRVLGFLPFIKHDADGFSNYWSHLNSNGLDLDLNYEFQRWQCNSLQVALMMGQQLGFGIPRVVPLMKAITTTSPLLTAEDAERAFRVIDVWMESIVKLHSAPAIPLPPKYYPNKSELDSLLKRSSDALDGLESEWLTKVPADITPKTAPQLFVGGREFRSAVNEGFPEEIANEVGDAAIDELSNKLLKEFLREDEETE